MFKLHRKIEYALMALQHMNQKKADTITSAKEIADIFHIPFDPTSRVLQIMTQHQILKAEQGAKGGYSINKNLAHVDLLSLSEMLVGPIEVSACLHNDDPHCDLVEHCQIIGPMLELNQRLKQLFADINIADLLGTSQRQVKQIRRKVKSHSMN